MLFERQYQATVYDQRVTSQRSPGLTAQAELTEDVVKQVITAGISSGKHTMAFGTSLTLTFPDAMVAGDRLLFHLRVEDGVCRLTQTSTEFAGNSIVLIYSTATQAGMYCGTIKPTTLVLDNPQASGSVKVQWTFAVMPDVTVETSFRGMQSTGLEAAVP